MHPRNLRNIPLLAICLGFPFSGCGLQDKQTGDSSPSMSAASPEDTSSNDKPSAPAHSGDAKQKDPATQAKLPANVPTLREPCKLPEGIKLGNKSGPSSIGDMVTLINALPHPVTIPCILDVLPRPLGINGSSSTFSAQPAGGPTSPRIFIVLDSLILSIVPGGIASDLLEMSELLNNRESIKAELQLPIKDQLSPSAPFDRVARADPTSGTVCSACHSEERVATKYDGKAFVSRALRQATTSKVDLTEIIYLKKSCGQTPSSRCDILRSLFGSQDDSVLNQPFPPDMPTMF